MIGTQQLHMLLMQMPDQYQKDLDQAKRQHQQNVYDLMQYAQKSANELQQQHQQQQLLLIQQQGNDLLQLQRRLQEEEQKQEIDETFIEQQQNEFQQLHEKYRDEQFQLQQTQQEEFMQLTKTYSDLKKQLDDQHNQDLYQLKLQYAQNITTYENQIRANQQLGIVNVHLDIFDENQVYNELCQYFGHKLDMMELVKFARHLIKFTGIEINRNVQRKKSELLLWYLKNWSEIADYL